VHPDPVYLTHTPESAMDKRTPSVEWMIAQNEADWQRLQGPPLPASEPVAHRRRRLQRYLGAMAALFVLLVSAGDWWWRTTRAALPQPTVERTAMPQPEVGTVAPDPDSLVASVMSNQSGRDWWDQEAQADSSLLGAWQSDEPNIHGAVALHRLGFQGDQAVVSIATPAKNGAPVYRQTRFYRRTATGWVQTAPDAALWGPQRSLATPYFVYHFRQNDVQTVIAVAPQMDALYRILWRNFGLPIIPTPKKLVIEVSVTQSPGFAILGFSKPHRFVVPSPAVYWAPVELTDADLLAQSIALPLLEQVLAQAGEHHAISATWQPMLRGLRLWQVWELELPLAAWRENVVQWIYIDGPVTAPGQSFVLPDRYAKLCAAYKLWMASPAQLNIPLSCARPEWEEQSFPLWRLRDPLTRLDQLVVPLRPGEYIEEPDSLHQVFHPGQTVALATLVEYAVAAYGRERLPALVAGLGQYENWDTLIPAVFGVSATEFEAGWQAYLTAHYGVPLPLRPLHN
jgi:hypothetical protein